jgi:2-polyprenyl-6-hydroxyphenyl methylase/3-demethylubiquinone-9 3-methyltransferase
MDRIAETFHGERGNTWDVERSRDRIHWMIQWARGDRALDWGCSQGIATKLLKEKGLTPIGYDIDLSVIEYARNRFPDIQFCSEISELGNSYDSILLGEVVEHQEDPNKFIADAVARLNPNGRVIITVPHGYNACLDHRQLFTLSTFLDLVQPHLNVVAYDFVDHFIRFVGCKEKTDWVLDAELHRKAELQLLDLHRCETARSEMILGECNKLREKVLWGQKQLDELKASPSYRLVDAMKKVRRMTKSD